MKVKHLLIGILVACALIVTPSGAYVSDSGYFITSVFPDENIITPFAAPVYGTITDGEEEKVRYIVPSGKTRLEISLIWSNSNNDLKLLLTQPNGVDYPILSDYVDGYTDAEITIQLNGNVPTGNWEVTIIGNNVNGSENYSLYFNAV